MNRDRELICPKCGNSIFIYDKETVCYCKNCKNDFRVIKENDIFSLDPVIVKEKKEKSSNSIVFFTILIIIAIGFFVFFYYLNDINNDNVDSNHGDIPISNK